MSAVLQPNIDSRNLEAANAAAASFASLVSKLDYLDKEGKEIVRKAYRFSDKAH